MLKDCIKEIIDKNFVSGDYFDSHTIINLILKDVKYRLVYMQEFAEKYKNCSINKFHGFVAQEIQKTDMVHFLKDIPVKTLNIYREPSENALWQKK